MARARMAACACLLLLACSRTDSGAGQELIPAEWTVAQDTAESGEVTTVSLQLPSARDIGGLVEEEAPRLILSCLDGRVQAFIYTESVPGEAEAPDSQSVQVQLDSAPACE